MMSVQKVVLPSSYVPLLDPRETERAIKLIEDSFAGTLAEVLNLKWVRAPLYVEAGTGINDDLNGVERPVSFRPPSLGGREVEVVQSLAKWKRLALADLGVKPGEGIYADLTTIRPDEELGPLHSLCVDQWEWEVSMCEEERTLPFLKQVVRKIYLALVRTEQLVCQEYPEIDRLLPEEITFVHAEELEERYPDLSPAERENRVARRFGAVFIVGVGASLKGGEPHDGRAPDYDDWITPNGHGRGLNGDLVVWYPVLGQATELSSMGIRVSPETLLVQLEIRGCTEWRNLDFHRRLLEGGLPLSVGGGIGRSRLCMYLLRKAHIGEVQASIWPEAVRGECQEKGIPLL